MMSAVPCALKRLMSAPRIWISAVCRSGCLAAMRSPNALTQRIFGKMSMQDFGSRGTVAVGGTTATSGTASDVPTSGVVLATAATSAALRASIHGTFEITTAGTLIPSIALDVATAAVVNAGSSFECIYLGQPGLSPLSSTEKKPSVANQNDFWSWFMTDPAKTALAEAAGGIVR